jgi:NADPH:quinone reductase-like Zn-dependent oxidoreductase
MKAIVQERYGGPENLRLADIPIPEPGKGEIRVKVLACAVNLSDWEYLVGSPLYARIVGGMLKPKRAVLGSDIVGIVEKLGDGVTGFSRGDRIMGDCVHMRGGFAEYACVTAHHMVPVPDSFSDEFAACLPQSGGIAVAGTDGARQGEAFLINGAGGGSGPMALQLAQAAGAHVTAVDHAGKTEWLTSLGAEAVIDYRAQDFARTGKQWDRILDMVATRGPVRIAGALSTGGIYRAAGGSVGVLLSLVFGGLAFRLQNKSIGVLMGSGKDLTERAVRLALEGKIAPQMAAVLPLSSVPDALRRTGLGEVKGKLVIRP